MIAAMVVPFGCRSIARTASCLEVDGAGTLADAGLVAAAPESAFGLDRVGPLALGALFVGRNGLRAALADLDFDLLVAIWLSLA